MDVIKITNYFGVRIQITNYVISNYFNYKLHAIAGLVFQLML